MKKLSRERRAFILFLCLSLLSALLITVDYHGKGMLGLVKDVGFLVLKPINHSVQNILNHLAKNFQIIAETEGIHRKNLLLEQENQQLSHENAILKEQLAAYERITKMVQFKEYYNYEMIPAQVIGREPDNWFHSIIVDMGSKDGVEIDMGVATYRGLVGKVIQVERNTSEVLLLTDQGCSIGAMVQRPREVGVIKGGIESTFCSLEYIAHDADIRLNDTVVTSGMGSTIPKGIIIGRVIAINKEKHDLFQRILIKPEIDFNKLEEVFLVKLTDFGE